MIDDTLRQRAVHAGDLMSLMRGKFYVFETTRNDRPVIEIYHCADGYDEDLDAVLHEVFMTSLCDDPVALHTGASEDMSIWLPQEVWHALVIRAYQQMTPQEIAAAQGDTAWEEHDSSHD